MAFAFGRDRIAAAEQGGGTQLWEVAGDKSPPRELAPKLMPGGGLTPYSLAFSPDGKLLCMGAQSGTLIWKVTDKDRKEPWLARHGAAGRIVGRAAFTPDGQTVVTAYRGDWPAMYVWKPDTPEDKDRAMGVPRPISSFALACDGRHVAVGTDQGTVYILRLSFPPLRPPAR